MGHVEHLGMQTDEITQWCDIKKSVMVAETLLTTPSQMISADADTILALHHIRQKLPGTYCVHHVYNYQDTQKVPTIPQRTGLVIDRNTEREASTPMVPAPVATNPPLHLRAMGWTMKPSDPTDHRT